MITTPCVCVCVCVISAFKPADSFSQKIAMNITEYSKALNLIEDARICGLSETMAPIH
jgi:hypothetical protein